MHRNPSNVGTKEFLIAMLRALVMVAIVAALLKWCALAALEKYAPKARAHLKPFFVASAAGG